MKKIEKTEPGFYSEFIRKKEPTQWEDISEIRLRLRKNLVEIEQARQCAYCEGKIETHLSHIDHLKKRHFFPQKTFTYNNLFASCNAKNHCANYKDGNKSRMTKEENGRVINPSLENPEAFFEYSFTGDILAKEGNKQAELTIEKLNLNDRSLWERRKSTVETIGHYYKVLPINEILLIFGEFESYIRVIVEAYKRRDDDKF